MTLYLEALKRAKISPNFWCSDEYFEKAGILSFQNGECILALQDGESLFPVLVQEPGNKIKTAAHNCWADMEGAADLLPNPPSQQFLDFEFIYEPTSFLDLSGGKWKVFRKNSRKWEKGKSIDDIAYRMGAHIPAAHIESLLNAWLIAKGEATLIHDSAVFLNFIFHGINRLGIYHKGELKALLVWDSNWEFINFRYCLCRPEPWLSEFARYRFFLYHPILYSRKLVNDGGCLDDPNLYAFKKKLNPLKIRKRFNWSFDEI